MSKDFLNFPDADHLEDSDLEPPLEPASQAGLENSSLGQNMLLFQEPLKDAKLSLELDLFSDDPCPIGSSICDDPFISYRDDSLSSPSYCGTPESSLNQHTSNSTSPDHFNTPSTPDSGHHSDIPSLDPINEFSNLDLKFTMPPSLSDSENYDDVDLEFRAPYISMNMDDDFPLISPSNSVMWGPQEPSPKKSSPEKLIESEKQQILPLKPKIAENSLKSSLAALLQSDVKKQPPNKHDSKTSRKEALSHKKWQGASLDTTVKNNSSRQRHFTPSRNGHSIGSSGHIIMLDSIPVKKQPAKTSASQRRNVHASATEQHSQSPPFGSHTATVKVNDRLIKVQVSVSELPTTPNEQKQPFPSPPDPTPKRTSPSRLGPTESPKRLKIDNGLVCNGPQGVASDSVLLNLLISGEDASRGYLCSGNSRYAENKQYEPAVISLPANDSNTSQSDNASNCTALLASESELLDSFLNISQYDAEVNAPIQSSHLLQGDDLLSALDHQPLLRNVSTLV